MDGRKIEEGVFKVLMVAATLLIFLTLALIIATVVRKGLPAFNLAMITQTPKGGYYLGKEGGVLNAILGSLFLAGGATFLAFLFSFPVVLYLNVYARPDSRLVRFTRFSLDVLWGVPSIVYGAFGFTIMLWLGLKASLLAGIFAVTLLVLPIMARAMDEVMRLAPRELCEASFSLGATRLETAIKVLARQSLPGIVTALLLAFGRGIGDAASVIFTAGFTDSLPTSLLRPAATLPLAVFFQLGTPIPEVQNRAYASALILTLLVLLISLISRVLSRRFTRHVVR
ncbi:MAG: phosphate ABC transporter permease PstA [Candidatus Aureabacteria bacterium]|nr:phosphate ABC transporter permease PstA [Candidatus Auribacterota bacterium]